MKRYLLILCATAGLYACSQPAAETTDKARFVRAELHNPSSRYVVVVSHRGDWRNWPENSIPAIESVIGMGVDIMELDLKLTKDSVLVLCHDKTIDRTTNGRGRVCDITYDSIRRCVLKTGHGVKTSLKMPTLREALAVCKGPHRGEYRPRLRILRPRARHHRGAGRHGSGAHQRQTSGGDRLCKIRGIRTQHDVHADHRHPQAAGQGAFRGICLEGRRPAGLRSVLGRLYAPSRSLHAGRVVAGGSKLWVNSLWDSLCGGLSDDKAFTESPDEVYGRLLDRGASIIQTDRPELLIRYLEAQGRRK